MKEENWNRFFETGKVSDYLKYKDEAGYSREEEVSAQSGEQENLLQDEEERT